MKRRDLLRGIGLTTAVAVANRGAAAVRSAASGISVEGEAGKSAAGKPIPASRGLHPQEALQAQRTARAQKEIAESLAKEGARPVSAGAYQMWNHCGGEEGKRNNLERMLRLVEQAQREGVQLLAFPEMCLPGYFTPVSGSAEEAAQANRALADTVGDSVYLSRLQEAADKAKMALVFGFAEKTKTQIYNCAGVINADGRWLGVRRKNPLYPWPYEVGIFAEPPATARSTIFDTAIGRIGVSVCFDGEFAESVRQMRLDGAELLVWINAACGNSTLGNAQRLNSAGAYAQANQLWIICCNCAAPNSSGTSSIYPPSGEPLVILSPDKEELGIASINLAMNKDWSIWKDRLAREVTSQENGPTPRGV